MSEKHIVVQGATVKCIFSVEPKLDKLKVKKQKKRIIRIKKPAVKNLLAQAKNLDKH
jgi:hypothetical protein